MCCSSFLLPPHPLDNISFISTSPLETHRRSLQVKEEPIRYMLSLIPRVKLIFFPDFDGFSFCINLDKNCEIWDVSIDGVDFCASRSPLTTRWNRMSPSLRAEFRLSKTMVNLGVLFLDRLKFASSHEWVKHEGAVATTAESMHHPLQIPLRQSPPTPTELSWIVLLYNSTPSFKKRAESDASVLDAPTRAEKFAQRYTLY
ncbi:hypothetical protein TB2_043466 [Malus domestica]